jgi:hypothetical protein
MRTRDPYETATKAGYVEPRYRELPPKDPVFSLKINRFLSTCRHHATEPSDAVKLHDRIALFAQPWERRGWVGACWQ